MTATRLLAFLGVLLLVLCTPGPDFLLVVRQSLRARSAGVRTALGVQAGLAVHTTAAALGLSALVAARPGLLTVLRIAGACYLGYLGVAALRAARRVEQTDETRRRFSAAGPFAQGMLGNVLNPKAVLFFVGLMPQFLDRTEPILPQTAALSAITFAASAMWWVIVVLTVSARRPRSAGGGTGRRLETFAGVALLGLAAFTMVF